MLTFANLAVLAAEWLAPAGRSAPAGRPGEPRRRLVLCIEREGSLLLKADGPMPGSSPPGNLVGACSTWDLTEAEGQSWLRIVANPEFVLGRVDQPATLFALHDLAARRPDRHVILQLPPEHVGRRW